MTTQQQTNRIMGDELAELDFVAYLAALGFRILSRRRVRRYDLTDGRDDKVLGLWTVSPSSIDNRRHLRTERERWAYGVPDRARDGMETDTIAVTRLALHNFRALTQYAKRRSDGCTLWRSPLGNLSRLNNERSFPGALECDCRAMEGAPSVGTYLAAVAVTHGCPLLGYTHARSQGGGIYLRWCIGKGNRPLADPALLLSRWRDSAWLLDPANDSPLAVAMMTLQNRRQLIGDTFRPRELTLLSSFKREAHSAEGAVALIDQNDQNQINRAAQALGI